MIEVGDIVQEDWSGVYGIVESIDYRLGEASLRFSDTLFISQIDFLKKWDSDNQEWWDPNEAPSPIG